MGSRISSISKACSICDDIFCSILEKIGLFCTEKEIGNFIRSQAKKRNLKLAFPSVVASGKNAAEIHHRPKNKKIVNGFLVMDFGVKVNGFCSDMTRTVHIGKASEKEKEMYRKLLQVQLKCVDMAKEGAGCFDIDSAARKELGSLRQYFTHSLGHGVSRKIHDIPSLSPRSAETLKSGDIVTVEPGIYIPKKLGIRIEDTVLVGKTPRQLTKSPKCLIEIIRNKQKKK